MTRQNACRLHAGLAAIFTVFLPDIAWAAQPSLDSGDTAWMLVSTALVLFMTIPGLFLFYAGLVQKRNVLSLMMQCMSLTALITLLWLGFGYSLAFDTQGMAAGRLGVHSFIGGLSKAFLAGVGRETLSGSIPEVLFFAFQLTFAIITPALMVGAFAERMKFSALLWFSAAWLLLVYLPICHMVWGGEGALLADLGVIDFAGGIVVHITAGIGALVACVLVGPRTGYPAQRMRPHNLTITVAGAAMLWVGWFGFNGGSALSAGADAAMAIAVTHISASTAALAWMTIEWLRNGKPSMLGLATGSIAGLAAITPASGTVGPVGGVGIGLLAGALCYLASVNLKAKLGYDDSLDVFGVHGVGGFVGTTLAGLFSAAAFGGAGLDRAVAAQVGVQLGAAAGAVAYTALVSAVILVVLNRLVGLRVSEAEERDGLDLTQHEELGYDL
jgi:Amt family ammonium transporter